MLAACHPRRRSMSLHLCPIVRSVQNTLVIRGPDASLIPFCPIALSAKYI